MWAHPLQSTTRSLATTANTTPPSTSQPHSSPQTALQSLGRTRELVSHFAREGRNAPDALDKIFSERRITQSLVKRKLDPKVVHSWAEALSSPSLYEALVRLDLLESAGEDRVHDASCPAWLFLALPALLRHPNEAQYLSGMFFTPTFRQLGPQDQGLFVARAIQFFIRCRHFVAAREAVDYLCNHYSPKIDQTRTFARCLQALTKDPSRPGSANAPPLDFLNSLANRLRSTMAERKIRPTIDTFRPLFSPFLIPKDPEQARALLADVVASRVTPPKELLHLVMKVYAAAGNSHGAAQIRDQIYTMAREERGRECEGHGGAGEPFATEGVQDDYADLQVTAEDRLGEDHLHVKLETTYLRSLTANHHEALEQFELIRSHIAANLRPDEIRPVLPVLIYALSRCRNFSAQDLLGVLNRLELAAVGVRQSPSRPTTRIYAIVLQGLIVRREYEQAIKLWNHVRRTNIRPDVTLVTIIVTALSRHGELELAERTLRQYASGSRDKPGQAQNKGVALDAVPLNVLMSAYSRAGRYNAAYALFKRFADYGVAPNEATISILLDTARYASATVGKGFGPGDEALPLQQAVQIGDRWDGHEAWRKAEKIMWSILEENWPDASRIVTDPRSSKEPLGRLRQLASRAFGLAPLSTTSPPFAKTLSPDVLHFPQIHPSERMFRSFIQLLGYHSTSESIPLVLAWMRHLDIRPDHETLVLAVLYIDEGAPTDSQRNRLREWLEEWLGSGTAPTDGIRDLVEADTETQRKLAARQANGHMRKVYDDMRSSVIEAMSLVEALIDFGEDEGISEGVFDDARSRVCKLLDLVKKHLDDGRRGEIIRSGFQIAIVGPPNAGKSSLLNWFAQRDAAIVTSTPGTTRDIVEVSLDFHGFSVTIADTAGIRETRDEIEAIGVERAKQRALGSDLKILVLDSGGDAFIEDQEFLDLLSSVDSSTIIVLNKSDLVQESRQAFTSKVEGHLHQWRKNWIGKETPTPFVSMSVKEGTGLVEFTDGLKSLLAERSKLSDDMEDTPLVTQVRHRRHLQVSYNARTRSDNDTHEVVPFRSALRLLRTFFVRLSIQHLFLRSSHTRPSDMGPDNIVLAAEELRYATSSLGRITGAVDVEEVLGEIFRGFCIGK
ncbi:tRNA modification GTPase, partial [Phenoliferia sp. Uapishka_3]